MSEFPRFGDELDTEAIADCLESYAERLRDGDAYLQGLDREEHTRHDEWTEVSVTLHTAGIPGNDLFDAAGFGDGE